MNQRLLIASRSFEHWVKELALPLWLKVGMDPVAKVHYERLNSDGTPDSEANVRVRVQARQVFVYAFAHELGWCDDAYLVVDRLWEFLEKRAIHPSAADGYSHLLNSAFSIIDSKQDLYDHAFFLLAYAWVYRAFGRAEALDRVNHIVAYLDHAFGSDVGGWVEGDYKADCRRQNPHMHLFEAFLTLYEVTGANAWLARASEIFGLFQTRFYGAEERILREYFDDNWNLLDGEKGLRLEPGHMMEWVWLLRWYERLSGRPVARYADGLYETANSIGFCADSGLMFDAVTAQGQVLAATKRCWPLTEVIKANIAQARAGKVECEERAAVAIEKLFEFYLSSAVPGSYIDQRGEQNEVLVDLAPASTLYHLVVAAAEVSRYTRSALCC